MSILLTGVTGFLGSRLLPAMLARDEPIIALTNRRSKTRLPASRQAMSAMDDPADRVRAAGRVELVDIELTAPKLGLPTRVYERLAAEATEIWHLAASTNLAPTAGDVLQINVGGVRNILDLASAARRLERLCHVSTAFVAGGRREGLVLEADLSHEHGFENPYEQSKYQAETLVRSWAREHGASVVILRPSILISDRPAVPGGRLHPLQAVLGVGSVSTAGASLDGMPRVPARIPASAQAHLNLMPVDRAIELMLAVAAAHRSPGAGTYHITHPEEVSMASLRELFESLLPVVTRLVPAIPPNPLPHERMFYAHAAGFLPYLFHRRRYDRDGLARLGLDIPTPPVSMDYLRNSMAVTSASAPSR